MARTKQTARKSVQARAGEAGKRKATTASPSSKRGASTVKTQAKPSAKEDTSGFAVVVTTIRSAQSELVSTKCYDSQALANAVVLEQWGAKTSALNGGVKKYRLFSNKAGYRKCVVSNGDATVSTFKAMPGLGELVWELEAEFTTSAVA